MLSFVSFCESSFVSPPALGSSAPSRGAAAAVSMSGVTRNAGMGKLQAGYLFPEIGRRRNAYLEANPDAKIISLGIGDTTMPVPPHILAGLTEGASRLGTADGYSGYGPENGVAPLREKIASSLYDDKIAPDEIFVSDGSKCDIGRLQMMFGSGVTSAVQDPSYPVYVDTSVMMGQTGEMDQATKQYGNIVYMPCNPGNGFFPDVSKVKAGVIYFCSPNNPTGAAATRAQLQSLVDHANKQGSIIVFDAAYAPFIRSKVHRPPTHRPCPHGATPRLTRAPATPLTLTRTLALTRTLTLTRTCPSRSTRSRAPRRSRSRSTRSPSTPASPACGSAGPSCPRRSSRP